jgi:alpha-L-fucosidase
MSSHRPLFFALASLLAAILPTPARSQEPAATPEPYTADWESLNRHRAAPWFEEAKFGIFIHWGVYSVPAFCDTSTYSEWYWHWLETNSHGGKVRQFHDRVYGKAFPYQRFAEQFRAELFDPQQWAEIFRRSGARYVVLTSKHHDGFALWPSKHASEARAHAWNAQETGPKRDLVGELGSAVRAAGLKYGLYYSFLEWRNPIYQESIPRYVERVMFPQVKELIARYQPDIFWPDGEWEHPETTWRAKELLAWIFNAQPGITVNDRWGKDLRAHSGDYYTTEYGSGGDGAESLRRPFEECRGIGHSFAFNRAEGYELYMERDACVRELVSIVARGGTLLLDIGPAADGTIPLIMVDRLLAIGRWLDVNGESIYGTTRSPFRRTPWGAATRKDNTLYLHLYAWPKDRALALPSLKTPIAKAAFLHDPERTALPVKYVKGAQTIDLRDALPGEHVHVLRLDLASQLSVDEAFRPRADGTLVLEAQHGELFGKNLKLEASSDAGTELALADGTLALAPRNLGYWNQPESGISWSPVRLDPGRSYLVELVCALKQSAEGSELELALGDRTLAVSLATPTGASWHEYAILPAGALAAGDSADTVRISAKSIAGEGALNLRAVILRPVR